MSDNEDSENKKEKFEKNLLLILAGAEILDVITSVIDRITSWFN